jgi:DNA-binding NtrC family response regulator
MKKKHTILIVDGDQDLRTSLKEYFGRYFNVITAFNGRRGCEMARECRPSMIICNYHLPILNGIGMLNSIQSDHPELQGKAIVMTTGLLHNEDNNSPLAMSIRMPFRPSVLMELIGTLLPDVNGIDDGY